MWNPVGDVGCNLCGTVFPANGGHVCPADPEQLYRTTERLLTTVHDQELSIAELVSHVAWLEQPWWRRWFRRRPHARLALPR